MKEGGESAAKAIADGAAEALREFDPEAYLQQQEANLEIELGIGNIGNFEEEMNGAIERAGQTTRASSTTATSTRAAA